MNKKLMSMMALVVAVATTGCGQNDTQSFAKKTVSINEMYFGENRDNGYVSGSKLYDKNGEYVGFIDTDNILYQYPNQSDPSRCGGEYVGICESTGDNTCNVPNFERVTSVGGGTLIPTYHSFDCGERF